MDRWVPYGTGGAKRFHAGCAIRPFRSPPTNYLTVSLGKGGKKTNRRIHSVMLEAFVGPRPSPLMDACHNNGIKDDLRIENLRWDTKAANAADAYRHGANLNGLKAKCKREHEFTTENTYINPTSGARQCRECVRQARGINWLPKK